jgi:hypothetical protein
VEGGLGPARDSRGPASAPRFDLDVPLGARMVRCFIGADRGVTLGHALFTGIQMLLEATAQLQRRATSRTDTHTLRRS